jgi:hypothetical protein
LLVAAAVILAVVVLEVFVQQAVLPLWGALLTRLPLVLVVLQTLMAVIPYFPPLHR